MVIHSERRRATIKAMVGLLCQSFTNASLNPARSPVRIWGTICFVASAGGGAFFAALSLAQPGTYSPAGTSAAGLSGGVCLIGCS
ncbi:hypothetical protein BO71DRAFT_395026, partial [Aspergillus ellipticus CBS 707.79]